MWQRDRNVTRRYLNTENDNAHVRSVISSFHTLAPETEKARLPTVV